VDPELLTRSAQLLDELNESSGGKLTPTKPAAAAAAIAVTAATGVALAAAVATAPPASAAAGGWKISLRFSPDVLLTGMDPLAFIRYLTTFGTITQLLVVEDDLPPLSKLNAHKCYVGFEIELETQEDQARVEA